MKLLKNLTLLFADDDDVIVEALSTVLKRIFHTVFFAKNGEEAIKIFKNEKIDICFLDVKMPFLNGIEAAKKIRNQDKKMPIVILTNSKEPDELIEIINLNILLFIDKPLNYDKLQNALLLCVENLQENNRIKNKLYENIEYDFLTKKIFKDNNEISLTKTEADLLEVLIKERGKIVTTETLNSKVWNHEMTTQALRNTIMRLRKKIDSRCIKNVHNMGYTLY